MTDWRRFDKALMRCLNDLEIVKAQRTAHVTLRNLRPDAADIYSGFLGLVNAAFNSSTQGGLAVILEKHSKRSSGFWWIHKSAKEHLLTYNPNSKDIAALEKVSTPLKELRDKTLFHISLEALHNSREFRKGIGLNYDEFDLAIELSLKILREIVSLRQKEDSWTQASQGVAHLDYDGSDIELFLPKT